MLIDIEGAKSYPPLEGFVLFPLPGKRVLWEASNATAWLAEFNTDVKDWGMFGLAIDGKVKRVSFEQGRTNITEANWEAWYSQMDSFGTLTMMASLLL